MTGITDYKWQQRIIGVLILCTAGIASYVHFTGGLSYSGWNMYMLTATLLYLLAVTSMIEHKLEALAEEVFEYQDMQKDNAVTTGDNLQMSGESDDNPSTEDKEDEGQTEITNHVEDDETSGEDEEVTDEEQEEESNEEESGGWTDNPPWTSDT